MRYGAYKKAVIWGLQLFSYYQKDIPQQPTIDNFNFSMYSGLGDNLNWRFRNADSSFFASLAFIFVQTVREPQGGIVKGIVKH